ncbi:uncharacterized protein PAC_11592 [Phialocephala subalpina]|uniref:Fungal N-terminal domain-containing protein n=1 Tax=Phialocephala subalpina TaxID=576137 RepID=A0A1L7X9I9_9HELO|nr:uncharacterized protein PAC_11592 [Phialocephala subalpina]
MMAEVIALTASILAIAGAATTALRVSSSLHKVARSLEAAGDDIEDFSINIRAFASIIQLGIGSLNRCTAKRSSPEVMKYLEDHEVLDQLAEQSKRTSQKIKLAWKRTKTVRSNLTMLTRIKWYFAKPKVQALQPEMETLKTSLLVVMQSIRLEEMQQGEDSEETRQEMQVTHQFFTRSFLVILLTPSSEDLKKQIKVQIKTIAFLQESRARKRAQSTEPRNRFRESPPLDYNFQHALVNLGRRMVEHEKVPDPKDYSPSDSTTSVHENSNSLSSNVKSRKPQRSSKAATSLIVPAVIKVIEEAQSPELRQERRRIARRHKQETPTESSNLPDQLSPVSPVSPVESERASLGPTVEEEFISDRRKNYLLELNSNSSHPVQSIQGYIDTDTSNGPVSSTALIDEGLDDNLISLARVQKLGLEPEPPDDKRPVWFTFENGEKRRSCGQVVIQWRERRVKGKSFEVRCIVYEHDVGGLVFGKPFLEERGRSRGSNGEVEVEER